MTGPPTLVKELYFPTPVYFYDLPVAGPRNMQMKAAIYAWRDADPEGVERSNVALLGSWHSPVTMHLRPEFAAFTAFVTTSMQHAFTDQSYAADRPAACDNMWANINPRHGFNRFHTHPNALWSGVYYVQTPLGSGKLCLHDPRVQAQMLTPVYRGDQPRQREQWAEVQYDAIAGRLILFPSWLGHYVQPNMTEDTGPAGDRISISFNYFQARAKGRKAKSKSRRVQDRA